MTKGDGMYKVLKRYDLDKFEVWMVGCGVVLVSIQVIEFYYSLFRGLL